LVAESRIVRHGGGPDVGGSRDTIRHQVGRNPTLDDVQAVGLLEEEMDIVERAHRTVVVEKGGGFPGVLVLECPAVGDIWIAGARVVDVDVVVGTRCEGIEVRSPVRLLEWNPVRNKGYRIGLVGAHERVDVGVVDLGVCGRERRLPVAGSLGDAGPECRRSDRSNAQSCSNESQCPRAPTHEKRGWSVLHVGSFLRG